MVNSDGDISLTQDEQKVYNNIYSYFHKPIIVTVIKSHSECPEAHGYLPKECSYMLEENSNITWKWLESL